MLSQMMTVLSQMMMAGTEMLPQMMMLSEVMMAGTEMLPWCCHKCDWACENRAYLHKIYLFR